MVFKRRRGGSHDFDEIPVGSLPLNDDPHGALQKSDGDLSHCSFDSLHSDEGDRDSYFWRRRKHSGDAQSLPSWHSVGNPQDDDRSRRPKQSLVFTARKRKSTVSFAFLAFILLGFSLYSSARSTLRLAVDDTTDLIRFTAEVGRQMQDAAKDVRLLERELAALDTIERQQEDREIEKQILDQAAVFADPKLVEEMDEMHKKLKISAAQAEKLKKQVSAISKRDAIDKYGAAPRKVEIELLFPGDESGPTVFVVEMAPIEVMPHSVHTFLEMVSAELLSGCSFILNARHVLKSAPLAYDGSPFGDKAQEFHDKGLESVAFREYSNDFPHQQNTLGFAADGTPSFYINTEDNTEIHEGDPCFARIVDGFDTIKRLEDSPTRNGIWFAKRIGIKRATILERDDTTV